MKINFGKIPDLARDFDYATAGWLNQNHDLLQGTGLGKINFVKSQVLMGWTLFFNLR